MRISDWSSDVCSSDLQRLRAAPRGGHRRDQTRRPAAADDDVIRADDGSRVLLVTKDVLSAGSTQWAQGGIAAALGEGDTPEQHERDTLVAGAGACELAAVRPLVTEGPDAVRALIALGTNC